MAIDAAVTMGLQEATADAGVKVLCNAQFATMGFLIDSLDQMLTFVEDERFLEILRLKTCVSAVITTGQLASKMPSHLGVAICEDPRRCFFLLQNALAANGFYGWLEPTQIHASARIHARATIAETGVMIGPHVTLGANAVIESGTTLMAGAIIQPGAVIGAHGFQTLRRGHENIEMTHAGGVVIEEDAIVFANATIARGLFRQNTVIGARARVGNNAFISHNVAMGGNSFVGHGAVINGNTRIGRECWVGPGAVVANGVTLGDKAFVSLGSVVISDLEADARVSGNFAIPHHRFLRQIAQAR